MKIMIVTDAWEPQVNGVVRTLKTTRARARVRWAMRSELLTPLEFPDAALPDVSRHPAVAVPGRKGGRSASREFDPDALHIATEGPLGMAARRFASSSDWPFTTAYHTRFPEYVQARFALPLSWTYAFLRWFHGPRSGVMVPTRS